MTQVIRVVGMGVLLAGLLVAGALAQQTSRSPLDPPPNGMRKSDPSAWAIVGATVHPRPGETVENATILVRDGLVERVDRGFDAEAARSNGYGVVEADGAHIYAGFIDAFVEAEAPKPDQSSPGAHWNAKVTPARRATDGDGIDAKTGGALRSLGFTAAGVVPKGGVFKGLGAVVSLAEDPGARSDGRAPVYRDGAFHTLSFETGGWNSRTYPGSHMGAVALVRQTLIDADWQRDARDRGEAIAPNTLDALIEVDAPLLFDTNHELKALHAKTTAEEFGRDIVIVGEGTELRRLDAVVAGGVKMIVPLKFPAEPDVSTPANAESVGLADLMLWEQAPTNPRRLDEAGAVVALTSSKVKKRGEFYKNLRRAIDHGLSEDRALAMLTVNPAEILGVSDQLGTIAPGRRANLVMSDAPIFTDKAKVLDVWIDGRRHVVNEPEAESVAGLWNATLDGRFGLRLEIEDKSKITVMDEEGGSEETIKAEKVKRSGDTLSFVFDHAVFMPETDSPTPGHGYFTMSATVDGDSMIGVGTRADGKSFGWVATREQSADDEEADKEQEDEKEPPEVPESFGTPFGPYAIDQAPEPLDVVFTNATVWTSAEKGVIEDGVVYISDGRISWVGTSDDWSAFQARASFKTEYETRDLEGKHITSGIIDCHSHTGLFNLGVNEGTQSCTAEVRIADAVDPGHINWYRQLAGGVTTVNSLHGSANPIGGQNLVQKVRWGAQHPDDMVFGGAPSGIKFALGENVKQSNWGDDFNSRYPQTRMGVETYIRDRFIAAREYAADTSSEKRRDLELEALAEILAGERLIHCHSYRQDEILMLCRVAEEFGFTIGTFQHVLEGYKVAEAIRERALGGSCFADWWAYKVEVQDAIPHNGTIMDEQGVVVSFNSDSDDLARRMNLEAAKAARYGSDDVTALEFVTINPAIQLGIEERVGSIEPGKDADLAVWSGHPLSTMSRCESTFVDGRELFSLEQDREHRKRIVEARRRIIQKILRGKKKDKKGGGDEKNGEDKPGEPGIGHGMLFAGDDAEDLRDRILHAESLGLHPFQATCGDCGTGIHQHK